ncbi:MULTISPECIES: virulence-associated E family protein [Empedobacter]|uniref:Virulence-associated E family protein n=1 Tax=Empedobacter falsenii TaxID=343874 RepID=A0AAW7DKE7_9FLAO|nr:MULTISPECIES: virulence-associated E family protein [Empedobacter]MCA4809589.1 virulence-associated E family protein [Empedobacter stercoris]MDM1551624.1 virulence-associated E family protein [Empedobacter falsenii]
MNENVMSNSVFDKLEYFLNSKYLIRFNNISLTYEFTSINSLNWDELNVDRLFIEIEKNGIKISYDKLLIYLKASIEHYNPIEFYFHNLPNWDGKDYIDALCSKIELNNDVDFFKLQFKKFLVRTILCACEKKIVNKNAIIFYSPKQNIGKTSFIRYLCPPTLQDYITENISNDKDSIIKVATNLIINLDEMQNFLSNDLDFVKSLISKEMINERLPYAKKSERIVRRASFLGSTNRAHILKDNSNVRWLVFEIQSFDFSYSKIDINKVWSQAYHLAYKDYDFNPYLTSEELNYNEEKNKRFRAFSKEEEELLSFIEESENENDFITATDLCFGLRKVYLHKNPVSLGKVLNNIGFKSKRVGVERTKMYQIKFTDYYQNFLKI